MGLLILCFAKFRFDKTLQNVSRASSPELHAPPGGPVVRVPEELVQQVLGPVQHDALVLGLGHQLGQHGGPTLACVNINNKLWIGYGGDCYNFGFSLSCDKYFKYDAKQD